jgi:NAD-dependent dihydropyrimidine dehydrogenase PreA subunit
MNENTVTLCLCASRTHIDKEKVAGLARHLAGSGYTLRLEADLCEKAIGPSAGMQEIAASTVIACYPRAVLSLFDRHGLKPLRVLDIRNNEIASILQEFPASASIPSVAEEVFDESRLEALPAKPGQDAWYPVLDKARCCKCGKCHDFCLFGVYAMEGKEVSVAQPRNCKINCPACARACPQQAIIFPKYPKSPINGGLTDEETTGADTRTLYNDALRLRLSQRRAGVSLLRNKPGNA